MPFLRCSRAILLRKLLPLVRQYAATLGTDTVTDFGPAFLPDIAGIHVNVCSNPSQEKRAAGLAISCFPLSELHREALLEQLEVMHRTASFVMLSDFKVPERNMEIPACLLMRGLRIAEPSHKECFHAFGGLEGLLYDQRELFAVRERHTLLGGSILCVLAESLR